MEEEAQVDVAEMAETQERAPEEKLVPQSEVNALVGAAKAQAAEKARRAAQAEMERLMQQQSAPAMFAQAQQAAPAQAADTEAQYQQIVERLNQEIQRQKLEDEMAAIANNFQAQFSDAAKNYEDYSDVTKDFDPSQMPELVYMLGTSGIPNMGDVVYELNKNPSKMAEVMVLIRENPSLAKRQISRLSASIAENRQALDQAQGTQTDAPLSRLQPSRVSGRGGEQSIRDLRSNPLLRG